VRLRAVTGKAGFKLTACCADFSFVFYITFSTATEEFEGIMVGFVDLVVICSDVLRNLFWGFICYWSGQTMVASGTACGLRRLVPETSPEGPSGTDSCGMCGGLIQGKFIWQGPQSFRTVGIV